MDMSDLNASLPSIPVHWDPGDQEISYCMNRTNGVSGEVCKMHINQRASCFDNHAQNLVFLQVPDQYNKNKF